VIQEFKDFINKGGIFEAAVGLIMALAFVPVVGSLVDDVIMPVVAAIVGQPDFSALTIDIGDAKIFYGNFLTVIVTFVIIGFVMFMLSKAYNAMKGAEEEEEEGPSEIDLLTEIRDALANR
jgi:large conductance mechanosensitive channel